MFENDAEFCNWCSRSLPEQIRTQRDHDSVPPKALRRAYPRAGLRNRIGVVVSFCIATALIDVWIGFLGASLGLACSVAT